MARPRKLPDGLRVRNGVYYADFYAGGRRVRKRLSGNREAARQIVNDMKARADKADFNLLDNDYPLAELKEQYLRHCEQTLKPKTVRRYHGCLRHILSKIGANRVSQVSVANVLAYREDRLAQNLSPASVNHEVFALSSMLTWGVERGLIGANPLTGFKRLRHDHPKEGRALTREEVWALLDASPQPWRDVWYAFLVTGMRKEELASLTFADIDHENRELVIRGGVAKNHRQRRIPIEDGLWAILLRLEAGRMARQPGVGRTREQTERIRARFSRERVFVNGVNTPLDQRSCLYHIFMRCCRRAGVQTKTCDQDGRVIEHVDLHSLRRTFATTLIVSGADPKSVQELLGHKTLEMTMKIYVKVHGQTKRQALGRLPYGQGATGPEHVLDYQPKPGFPGTMVKNRSQASQPEPQVLVGWQLTYGCAASATRRSKLGRPRPAGGIMSAAPSRPPIAAAYPAKLSC